MRLHDSGIRWSLGLLVAVCALALSVGAAEEEVTSAADVGKGFYEQYCSACHGPDGRGTGDFANLLKTSPMDLTGIAERRGGDFPSLEIAEIIDGRKTLRAHGTAEMPIWGERLGELRAAGQGSEVGVRGQIYLIVEYLRSIQGVAAAAQAEPAEVETKKVVQVGEDQFLRNCASCHGMSGVGDGYVGKLLETPPANLRTIAERNGGTFPALKIAEIIDGRQEVKAHGPREMPVWGRRFSEMKPPGIGHGSAVRGEVMLYVTYLQSIQD